MTSFIVVVCLTVLVGMATPCCLPDQISFDYSFRMNYTSIISDYGRWSQVQTLDGSGSFDFAQQKFYVTMVTVRGGSDVLGKAFLDLDKKNGKVTTYASFKRRDNRIREECNEFPFAGEFGKPWQCLLDDEAFFMGLGGDYLLNLAPNAYGLISMMSGTCAPTRADVNYTRNSSYAFTTVGVQLEVTNVESKIVDKSVFKPPCKAEITKVPPSQIPTPDEFKRMLLGEPNNPDSAA